MQTVASSAGSIVVNSANSTTPIHTASTISQLPPVASVAPVAHTMTQQSQIIHTQQQPQHMQQQQQSMATGSTTVNVATNASANQVKMMILRHANIYEVRLVDA